MMFYFIVIIIVLNLIFGVIIDTFADLRLSYAMFIFYFVIVRTIKVYFSTSGDSILVKVTKFYSKYYLFFH